MARTRASIESQIVEWFRTAEAGKVEVVWGLVREIMKKRQPPAKRKAAKSPAPTSVGQPAPFKGEVKVSQ